MSHNWYSSFKIVTRLVCQLSITTKPTHRKILFLYLRPAGLGVVVVVGAGVGAGVIRSLHAESIILLENITI